MRRQSGAGAVGGTITGSELCVHTPDYSTMDSKCKRLYACAPGISYYDP